MDTNIIYIFIDMNIHSSKANNKLRPTKVKLNDILRQNVSKWKHLYFKKVKRRDLKITLVIRFRFVPLRRRSIHNDINPQNLHCIEWIWKFHEC